MLAEKLSPFLVFGLGAGIRGEGAEMPSVVFWPQLSSKELRSARNLPGFAPRCAGCGAFILSASPHFGC